MARSETDHNAWDPTYGIGDETTLESRATLAAVLLVEAWDSVLAVWPQTHHTQAGRHVLPCGSPTCGALSGSDCSLRWLESLLKYTEVWIGFQG